MIGQHVNNCIYDLPYWGPCGEENCEKHKDMRCQFRPKKTCCIDITHIVTGKQIGRAHV